MQAFKVPSIFTVVDKASSVIKNITNNTDKLQRSFRRVGKQVGSLARTGTLITATVATPLIASANSAVDFESKMSNVGTIIDTNTESLEKMGNQLLNMSTKLPVSVNDLTVSLYDIRSAGISADEAMSTLNSSAKLSVVGLSSVSDATNITTSAINAFSSENLKTEEIVNKLFKTVKFGKTNIAEMSQAFGATAPIVQSAGVKLDEFLASQAALTTVGTPVSQAQNQIRASVVSLQKPTAEMIKIYQSLGVAGGEELIKKQGGLVPAMKAIQKEGKALGLNMSKAWSSVEASAAVTSLTGQTNKAYVETLKSMKSGTDSVSDAFDKQSSTAKSGMQIAKNNMKTLAITVGNVLIPIINKLVQRIIPIIQSVVKWAKENPNLIKGITIAAGALAAFTAVMWLVNIAMNANPIGLLIVGVSLLIAGIYSLIENWDTWKNQILESITNIPILGDLINFVIKTWQMLEKVFTADSIIGALKAIGAYLLDFLLSPLQTILELASYIPGFIGKAAEKGAKNIENFRRSLGIDVGDTAVSQLVNAEAEKFKAMQNTETRNVNLTIKDQQGNEVPFETNSWGMPVSLKSTTAF